MAEVRLLMEHYNESDYRFIDGYKKRGGYSVLAKSLKMKPAEAERDSQPA